MEKQQVKGSLKVLCVYKDKKANLYTAPMLFDNEETALRHFDNMSNRDVNICDYDLYLIGHYSDLFGSIELLNNGEKYLLRSGDYYYDYISNLKNFTKNVMELKEKYREEYRTLLNFAKTLFKEFYESYNEESFSMMLGDFEENYNKDTFKVGDYIVKK